MIDFPDWLEFSGEDWRRGSTHSRGCENSPEYRQANCIQYLNGNGKHYMAQQGTNRHLGVEVLIKVNDSLDELYFYLQENPILCNIN